MKQTHVSSGSRLLLGALAGMAGTMAMTMAMQHLHRRLPRSERYPLPPREIVALTVKAKNDDATAARTTLAHFTYGAGTGAFYGLIARRHGLVGGTLFGMGVWAASYLGWIPIAGILKPATAHPPRRNALMLLAHGFWGALTALGLRELIRAHRGAFAGGALRDAAPELESALHARGRSPRSASRHLHRTVGGK